MVYRSTPLHSAYRGYVAGGARSVVDAIDDATGIQEMSGSFMKGETRGRIESPQNYGFTSVTADADQQSQQNQQSGGGGGQGSSANGGMGPEAFVSFMGGNRSHPIAGVIDDRRHRLFNLAKDAAKGSTAQYGMREWGEQFLISDKGVFLTGNKGKTQSQQGGQGGGGAGQQAASGGQDGQSGQGDNFRIKLQLVENKNKQQQGGQGGGGGGGAQAVGYSKFGEDGKPLVGRFGAERKFFMSESGVEFEYDVEVPTPMADGGGSSGGGSQTQQGKGQKSLHKEQSEDYLDMTSEQFEMKRGPATTVQTDKFCMGYHGDKQNSYRCDPSHTHVRFGGSNVWVNKGGCYSSKPLNVKPCKDSD